MIWRIFFYCVVLTTAATGPVWIFLPAAILYTVRYAGIEIILVAVLIDAYFGYGHVGIPWYTVGTVAMLTLARFLRPYISVYNR